MLLMVLTVAVASQAQRIIRYNQSPFHEEKCYIGASLSSFDLNYSGLEDLKIGASAQLGYFVVDDVMLSGEFGYNNNGKGSDYFTAGVGARYYIQQNCIFLGVKGNYIHQHNYNDILPGVEVGYAFFLSRTVTIEPSLYYNQSFKKHSDFSNVGVKIGFGIYLND